MKILPLILLITLSGPWAPPAENSHPPQSASPRKDIPAIAKAANGSVVSIVMSDKDGKPVAQGSGFFVSKDGLIVTNYHVIAEGSFAVVKLPDGAFYVVDGVLASNPDRDIAIIKAHGQNFRTLTLGNSDRVQVGEEVVAIGNPLSLESTVSNGIVSGIRTADELGGKFLQTTAPISPGSSGGPLFNMAGEVIGITTMHIKGGENLNFAIPINDAKDMLFDPVFNVHKFADGPFPNESPKEAPTQGSERSRLAWKYRVEEDQIQIDPQPHDCDYETAPIGKKWCHYSRTVIVCAYGPCRSVEGDTNTWLRTPEYFILHSGERIHVVAYQAIDDKYRMQLLGGWVDVLATDVAKTEPDKKIFVIWNKVQE